MSWRNDMRLLLLGLFVVAGCGVPGAAPAASVTTRLVAMSFTDSVHGWLVAAECPAESATATSSACRTLAYQTVDGGGSWVRVARFLLSPRALQFVDNQTGWLIGSIGEQCGANLCPNVVMLSQDGGKSWNRVAMASAELLNAAASSRNDAWAIGRNCRADGRCHAVLVKTTSGGEIWDNQDLSLAGTSFHVDRFDQNHGWIGAAPGSGGLATILVTTNGGATWQAKNTPCAGSTVGLDFSSPVTGWLVCNAATPESNGVSTLFRTADGGESWTKIAPVRESRGDLAAGTTAIASANGDSAASADPSQAAVVFSSPTVGWVALPSGVLLVSSDGGQSWRAALDSGETLRGIQFVDANHGWLLGSRSLWRTSDGGQTWLRTSAS